MRAINDGGKEKCAMILEGQSELKKL